MVTLDVIIAGGGICGLSCAIGLRRAGHRVQVYERQPPVSEFGAGIVLPPNGNRVLKRWGLDLDAAGMMLHLESQIVNGRTMETTRTVRAAASNDEKTYMTVRSDLHKLLVDEATRTDDLPEGEHPVRVHYNTTVVDYDPDTPAVHFADGTTASADLVVAADGIRSKAAEHIAGSHMPAIPTGISSFRVLVPASRLTSSPIFNEHFTPGSGLARFADGGDGRLVVWWPVRGDSLHALDIMIPDNPRVASTEEWRKTCPKQVLLDEFAAWHPLFRAIFAAADDPNLWKICAREPFARLHKGRLCMLGDALHPMPPFRAQGGTSSIEDAGALEALFCGLGSKEEVAARLEVLDKLRIPRTASIQLASTMRDDMVDRTKEWEALFARMRDQYYGGKDPHGHFKDKPSFMAWLLRYDVFEEAENALKTAAKS